jgi:hypothetical protein
MLIVLRILFGGALAYMLAEVRENAQLHPNTGDLANAGYLAICVALGIANAVVWAPYFGAKISEPLTDPITTGTYLDEKNRFLQLIRWFEARGHRRWTLFFCFLEGVRRPWMPTPFVIGLKNSKPGTWLEKVFAREVYRFNNTQNCVVAYEALQRHGLRPDPHPNPEVDLALLALHKPVRPESPPVPVPPAPPTPPLARNPRIQLFEAEESGPAKTAPSQAQPALSKEPEMGSSARDRVPDSDSKNS